ncbi:MAG: NUDIX domain-containing protein [Pseudomonadota bacterium]
MQNNIHVLSRAVVIDQNHILLCKTVDLPINFYFLPGGHIEHKESAETAVLRELVEETGETCTIKRFLGCLEYSFEPGHNSICHNHEYNFIFEAESDALKIHIPIPHLEKHIELQWIPFDSLGDIDFRPAPLNALIQQWLAASVNDTFQSVMI